MQQMQQASPKVAVIVKCDHVMIDLETLAATADAVIMSIGAVKFNMDGYIDDKGFYAVCSMDQPRRYIDQGTLAWWFEQSKEAQAIFTDPNRISLETALHDLKDWYRGSEKACLWSNGADFDIPMINHALRQYDIEPLTMSYWNHRCFRTLKQEYAMVPKPAHEGAAHNALVDAIQQAKWAQDIAEYKRGIKPPPAKNGFAAART